MFARILGVLLMSYAVAAAADESHSHLRLVRNSAGTPVSLETAITRYQKGEIKIDLIGAVHVGERAYYEKLDEQFKEYEVLLYELVAPKGTIPESARSDNPIALMQGMMTDVLGLHHQLTCINYKAKNFVHGDLSFEDLKERMASRGDTPATLILETVAQHMRQSNLGEGGAGIDLGDEALLIDVLQGALTGQGSPRLKRQLAQQFEDMDKQMGAFGPNLSQLIIQDRNEACMKVLTEQLEGGIKTVGIFYGAAHLADFEKRLKEMGFKSTGQAWVQAWNLR